MFKKKGAHFLKAFEMETEGKVQGTTKVMKNNKGLAVLVLVFLITEKCHVCQR